MAGKTKRQITIETHSITIIRTKGKSNTAFCEHCGKKVTAFPVEQIAEILQMDVCEVYRQIEVGEFHLIKGEYAALVCGSSLNNEKK
ncbi:MAG: hypothetical protein K1X72_15295 [Pyrinomonadaceae bacterium]|nr:hypothetical protein [Pyrinomonadaceae bacterium]